MFCFQCQETAKNTGCTVKGMCGKPEETANLQDLLIFVLRGIAIYGEKLKELGQPDRSNDDFVLQGLFATITNANWDDARFEAMISEGLARRDKLRNAFLAVYKAKNGKDFSEPLPEAATWTGDSTAFAEKAKSVGILATENEDVRSLRELLIIGLKGVAAYAEHAAVLGFRKTEIDEFMLEALASTTKDLSVDEMVALVMKAGGMAVTTMALLDEAKAMMGVIISKAPMAVRYAKVAINKGVNMDLMNGLELEKDVAALAFASEDAKEGTAAFLAKRPAVFQNK